jgi:hypothetical protein
LKVSKWEEWQGHALDYMAGRRVGKDRPSSIEWFRVASTWGQSFVLFAMDLGDPCADAYMMRLLQYVATHSADTGEVSIPRHLFGSLVLSTPWHPVSQEKGECAWDALHLHGICIADAGHPLKTVKTVETVKTDRLKTSLTSEASFQGNGSCDRCDENGALKGTVVSCRCGRGRARALMLAKGRAADQEQAKRAAVARAERPAAYDPNGEA